MSAHASRTVSLTPELAAFVDRLVAEGVYRSTDDAVRDGLRLLQRHHQSRLMSEWLVSGRSPRRGAKLPPQFVSKARAVVDRQIRAGLAQLERGEFVDGATFFKRWRKRLRTATRRSARRRAG